MTHANVQEPATMSAAPNGADAQRRRAAIIINPYSSGMTSKRERTIVTTLRERMDLDVCRTERGGHAPVLAQELVDAGEHDVIIACGGDGTANEVLNGMQLDEGTADSRPDFAILPAGGTNVVARGLGFPNHPVRAMRMLGDKLVERSRRPISLGKVDERIFVLAAGVGMDGELIKRCEERRRGRRPSDFAQMLMLTGIYASSRFALPECMTVTVEDTGEELRSATVMVGNVTPMTYIGRFAMHVTPQCTLEGGLDFVAPRRLNALVAIGSVMQAAGMGRKRELFVSTESAQLRHDVGALSVTCDEPQPVQADGEYIGNRTHIRFETLRRAVHLVA